MSTIIEDTPPENEVEINISPDVIDVLLKTPDSLSEEEPSEIDLALVRHYEDLEKQHGSAFIRNFSAVTREYESVRWPTFDRNSPDYAHVSELENTDSFELTADVLDRLIALNHFEPYREKGVVAFAFRGAKLAEEGVYEIEEIDAVRLMNIRPNHIHFNCIIGFYFIAKRKLSVYAGSTVPCRNYVYQYSIGTSNMGNLLPCGLYTYYIWRHRTIKPALRLAESADSVSKLENGQFSTVLRTKNDATYGTRDIWDKCQPLDNIHCSYTTSYNPNWGSYFSSAGCLTVRGKRDPSDQWQKFQAVLNELGMQTRVDLILLTGKDAALAAKQINESLSDSSVNLVRLRVGSRGAAVEKLQQHLGHSVTGYFGFNLRKSLTDYQLELTRGSNNDAWADGIYSPSLDERTGWHIFSPASNSLNQEFETLRAISLKEFEDSEPLPEYEIILHLASLINFEIKPSGEPQEPGTKFTAKELPAGTPFLVAKATKYGSRKGLVRSSTQLIYDRFDAEREIGLWAHFMWPTAMGESSCRHITLNTYDRAKFTWGFYQLAAHTAKDNLILLMRELLKLEKATIYFPDLTLINGRVHQDIGGGVFNDLEYEVETPVGNGTEIQIQRFMHYLNPSSDRIENREIINSAKFVHWAKNDPQFISKTIDVSLRILKRKARNYAARYNLYGRRPELAIWICDMFHQGRGSVQQVKTALAKPIFEEQLEALSKIDTSGRFQGRLTTVKKCVDTLIQENRFADVRFGEGSLDLHENP